MGVRDGSDKLVSTPGAPNIRIVPSIVPIERDDVYQAKPYHRLVTHQQRVYSTQDQTQGWWRSGHDQVF